MEKQEYKNKLVLEIVKEIKEIEEKKELEEKKYKIRQMLSIILNKEKAIETKFKEIDDIQKNIKELKEQLDKEDFSSLSKEYNLLNILYDRTITCPYLGIN